MNEQLARARLERMTQASSAPGLSSSEIDDLLALARRSDADGNQPYSDWLATWDYDLGETTWPVPRNGHVYIVTVAGTTGIAAPAWPTTSGATVADGTVTWTEAGLAPWVPTFDLDVAAAEGWRWKAGKATARFNFAEDGQRFDRAQVYQHCVRMTEFFAQRMAMTSLPLISDTVRADYRQDITEP